MDSNIAVTAERLDYLMGRTRDPWPVDNPQPEEATK
ncbi:hypothetical protein G1C97_0740 [Bifidobacterium sp. DSM 109959]|uniref:Uncharacterized protein n=1 Tax=Bifidobacterium olomucense TaxID=2675324 RepID=A0A7Y0EWM9_9BIFI|nr:hypothetical protein [Bifidobacterium sp. DSM 109959]